MKLIELAKVYACKIVTNDFNLEQDWPSFTASSAQHQRTGQPLSSPSCCPAETMRVFILKEGKEYNQGVAYLDDGTMVVVDNAKRLISKTVDITVTSVLQTTAGKMISAASTSACIPSTIRARTPRSTRAPPRAGGARLGAARQLIPATGLGLGGF